MATARAATNPSPNPRPDPAADGPPSPSSALAPPSASHRRLAPPCWTHEETLDLIDAYREKWYDLRRGNLRASHWQEVADAVRGRCQRPAGPKTAVQCRHKLEKLRQRYRAEKQRLALRGKPRASSWVYFGKMDDMELGAFPSGAVASSSSEGSKDGHSSSGGNPNNAQLPQRFNEVGGEGANGDPMTAGALKFRIPKALRSKVCGARTEERANAPNGATAKPKPTNGSFKGFCGVPTPEAVEEKGQQGKKGGLVWDMVAAVRILGDEFTRIEEMKMEMARDMDKLRREMELKRTEMILDSQRQIVEFISGLHEKKRAKVAPRSQ